MKINKKGEDCLFLAEILNDLHVNGFIKGGKADTMLKDWKHELQTMANFPKTRQRAVHARLCGAENWNG